MNIGSTFAAAALSLASFATAAASQSVVADWPQPSRQLAESIIQEYGIPDAVQAGQVLWTGRPPWSAVVVYRDALDADHPGGLQRSVAYEVSVRKWRALAAFDRGVDYDPVKRELVARTDGEKTNFLALNLADEIIRGRRTVEEARVFYDKTLALSFAGKSSAYTSRLLFRPQDRPEPAP